MLDESIIDAAVGPNHILALTQAGSVYAFGYNRHGQLGIENVEDIQETPIIVPGIDNISALAAGGDFSVALKSDGTVWAWGKNDVGQIGHEIAEYRYQPGQIAGISNIVAISGGGSHTLALKNDGTIFAWGANDVGQLGIGTIEHQSAPVQVGKLHDVTAISAGIAHGLALRSDGTVWSWGNNDHGQLGTQTETSFSSMPIQVPGLSDIVVVTAGRYYSLAVNKDGEVWAWGENEVGQLGIGNIEPSFIPVKVEGITDIISIAAGRTGTMALQRNGMLWGWGDRLVLPGLPGGNVSNFV